MTAIRGIAVALALVAATACAGESQEGTAERFDRAARTPGADADATDAGTGRATEGSDKKERQGRAGDDGGSGPATGGSANDGGSAGSDGDGSGGGAASGGAGGASQAPYPAAGRYVFAQDGYEEYCQQSSCDRQALPGQQPVTVSHRRASNDSADVVMEVRASRSRVARTVTRFTGRGAYVVEVYVRSEYRGLVFEETYTPEPPVESMRFPIAPGEGWTGRWRDSTSGSYAIRLGRRERVKTGAGVVEAVRFVTDMEFSGQLNGKSRVTGWIDPDTKTIVKTDGVLNVTSTFGRYSTSFRTVLSRGPGFG